MPATGALSGYNTLLQIGDGGTPTENFTTIAEVQSISGPGLSLGTVDVTHMQSTNRWREFIATLPDAGQVTCDLRFIPTNATHSQSGGLIRDLKNRTKRNFKLVFPDSGATTWSFSAYVTAFEPAATVDGALTASVTLRITGEPTLAG